MANKKTTLTSICAASEGLITLESLQAAVRSLPGRAKVRQSGIRICSCNIRAAHSGKELGEHEESTFEHFAQA